jgi:predicted metal-dependent phosphoesterase TrpH
VPKVDLHIHSSVSDGLYSPAEVVSKAAKAGLTTISLTDHDNVDGIAPALEAAASYPPLRVIPGVEISTDIPEGEVHILGYFIDHTNRELLAALEKMRGSRIRRAQKMIAKLAELGLAIDWERVKELAGSGSVGRPHIAQALLEKGYITTFKEAFTKYIASGGPAYVPRDKLTPEEAVNMIIRADGLPVVAHPLTFGDPEALVKKLIDGGLVGIEVYYKDYTTEERDRLSRLAEKYGLIKTGGSDYHGLDESTEVMMGEAGVPPEVAEKLISLAEQRMLKTTIL